MRLSLPQLKKVLWPATVTAVLVLGLAGPSPAPAAVTPQRALLEDGTFSEFDQTNAANGSLTNTGDRAYEGSRSAHARYSGGGSNGYARGIFNVSWQDGDEVWYGGAFYLPQGFKASQQGQVDLVRWDNYPSMPTQNEKGGVVIYGSDKRARLVRIKQDVEQEALGSSFELPEGRWFWLEVHQRLSQSNPLSEAYVDGARIASSTEKNSYGHAIDRIRYGLVAISSSSQTNPLELWFDKASVSLESVGSGGGEPGVASPPDTKIESGPTDTTSGSAAFSFSASQPGASFECRLDGSAWSACASPKAYSGLQPGPHRFEVRAKDAAGTVDSSPAVWTWNVLSSQFSGLATSFESGSCTDDFAGEMACSSARGSVEPSSARASSGLRSLKAYTNGSGGSAYARGQWKVSWPAGGEISYGASLYLPSGFKSAVQGQVDLLRWDNYGSMPSATESGGISIYRSDKRARVVRQKDGVESVAVTPSFNVPEGRWFRLEVLQRTSTTAPYTEVRIDGARVASSSTRNAYAHAIDRMRFGLVATAGSRQLKPLTVYVDAAYAR